MNKVLSLVCGTAFLASCMPEPLAVVDFPAPPNEIVVSSQYIPSEYVTIALTKTFDARLIGEASKDPAEIFQKYEDQIVLKDAEVILASNHAHDTLEILGSGLYAALGVMELEELETYALKIKDVNGKELYAESKVLPRVNFDKIEADLVQKNDEMNLAIEFSFDDPDQDNWYMMSIQRVSMSQSQKIEDFIMDQPFTFLFTDKDIPEDGRPMYLETFYQNYNPSDTLMISMANISQEYHEYLELRNQSQGIVNDVLIEPVNYPSNVTNGLGFFNLHLSDIALVDLATKTVFKR
ncbi:DUF4249 domain-containing protein [Sediminitomix flava]|uniref:Uncharacterized protein DUF4249 n=1 Tax=Sediminitomix flava TaxID=379075 RepID=A0A315YWG3_SEDFL|nr:DUF4249 domain-containing protein [Sediminitomix flava]PWJ34199.1 uncharacterized protein DUF4249 [Sediminitomix flava]